MTSQLHNLAKRLNERRERLGLSCAALATKTGLSLRTVQRILGGKESDPGFATIASLADALGVKLRFDEEDIEAIRQRQAERKAKQLVALVQGNSAMESQGLPRAAIRDLRKRTVHELLAGSSRKLWAES
jgi:transcriptional regulator with XRE-family HTH domain